MHTATTSRYDITPSASVLMHRIASDKSSIERCIVDLTHHTEEAKRLQNLIDEMKTNIKDFEAALKKLKGE